MSIDLWGLLRLQKFCKRIEISPQQRIQGNRVHIRLHQLYLLISRNDNGVHILSVWIMGGISYIILHYSKSIYDRIILTCASGTGMSCVVSFLDESMAVFFPRFLRSKLIIIILYPAIIKWISIEHIVIIAGQIDKSFPSNNQMDLLFSKSWDIHK